ncbi:MAG: molybdopterin-guanine dinucleotide biosynthesis protein B [Rickettsiales bacterium]|mgnify:FL=1|nr:molybdopterin-guanine dinucleotide biosynthesis protein B [Rickettsiales bacterium]
MKVFGIAGWSGSGKTTLITKLIPEIINRGRKVSTIKHTHHSFDIDKPGKDSHSHRLAGATEVLVGSSQKWALIHEDRENKKEADIDTLISRMEEVDLVLVEGFKNLNHTKIEIFRNALKKPTLFNNDNSIVAIVSDCEMPEADIPKLDSSDIKGIADFIINRCGL